MTTTRGQIAHLYRRAGFGIHSAALDAAVPGGYAASVNHLLSGLTAADAGGPRPPRLSSAQELNTGKGGDTYDEFAALVNWWLEKMAYTTTPLREKLTLLLHGQFPTGIEKVGLPIYMYRQNEIFRNLGAGPFDRLTSALSLDPAMLIWLDVSSNQRLSPNENFARELMERFTMGVGNYSQRDVREAARAFTGWGIAYPSGGFEFDTWAHDFGEKSFLGFRGNLDGEDIVRIVTHSDAAARFIPARMWSFLAYPVSTSDPVVTDLAAVFRQNLNMTALLRSMLMHPQFVSSTSMQGLVKQPIEWMASILRAFKLHGKDFEKQNGSDYLRSVLTDLGQVPFNPPTVGGWGSNQYWLSSASSLAQFNFAQAVFQVADLSPVEEAAGPKRVDAIGAMLGVDSWGTRSNAVLQHVRDDLTKLVPLALTAPELIQN